MKTEAAKNIGSKNLNINENGIPTVFDNMISTVHGWHGLCSDKDEVEIVPLPTFKHHNYLRI